MKRFRKSRYWIKQDGKVLTNNQVEKKPQNVNDYAQVMLYIDRKYTFHYVHKLVAECFLPNPNGYSYVKHKDGNHWNNNVSNLEWSPKPIRSKVVNFRGSVPDEIVDFIREHYQNPYNQQELAEMFKISQSYISNLVNNKFRKIKNPTE